MCLSVCLRGPPRLTLLCFVFFAEPQVLQCLHRKGIVDWKTLKDMTEMLAEREAAHKAADESSDETVSGDDDKEVERQKRRRFSDTLIQQRMEEDRERVRHLRQTVWA